MDVEHLEYVRVAACFAVLALAALSVWLHVGDVLYTMGEHSRAESGPPPRRRHDDGKLPIFVWERLSVSTALFLLSGHESLKAWNMLLWTVVHAQGPALEARLASDGILTALGYGLILVIRLHSRLIVVLRSKRP